MGKKIIALYLDEVDVYSLDELKKEFTVAGVIACRNRLHHWLKNQCGAEGIEAAEKIERLSSDSSDDQWAEQVAKILGCDEKYRRYKTTQLIRSNELPNDEWVKLVRKVGYDEVDMPREELDRYKKAAEHNPATRKKELARLIRSKELPNDEWVKLVRKVGYDEVDMPREELDRYKKAAEKKTEHPEKPPKGVVKKTAPKKKPGSKKKVNPKKSGRKKKDEEKPAPNEPSSGDGSSQPGDGGIAIGDVVRLAGRLFFPTGMTVVDMIRKNKK